MIDPAPPRRRLLLVTYWYPPAVGAAAERMHSFAKYLPAHGWDVRVLTAGQHESAPLAEPGVTHVVDPRGRREGAIADYDPRKSFGWTQRLRGLLRDFLFPDRFRHWQQAAFSPGLEIVREWKPDILLVSFPPASAVELALRLHETTGVPLVLDYRDKWLGPGGYEPRRKSAIRKHVDLERRTLTAATGTTAVSEALIGHIRDEFQIPANRTAVIYNGFEPAPTPANDLPPESRSHHRRFIAHVGTVIPRNRPELFFSTLCELMAKYWGDDDMPADPDPYEGFRFRFVGNLSPKYLTDVNLADWVTTTGLVPRQVAREEMFNADALLLLSGNYVGKWGYSVKLFEYLQTGRPILCLEESAGSNDARLLRELAPKCSFIGRLGDPSSLVEQLFQLRKYLLNEKQTSMQEPASHSPGLARFSRANQAASLAMFLEELVNR